MIDASKLTDEQLRMALRAYHDTKGTMKEALRAAAPYLQMPWDQPTEREWGECMRLDNNRLMDNHLSVCVFVEKRNFSLLSSSPDPLIDDVVEILSVADEDEPITEIATRIVSTIRALQSLNGGK